eukprot:1807065-Pleurochrysis_carterae.AAC.2
MQGGESAGVRPTCTAVCATRRFSASRCTSATAMKRVRCPSSVSPSFKRKRLDPDRGEGSSRADVRERNARPEARLCDTPAPSPGP